MAIDAQFGQALREAIREAKGPTSGRQVAIATGISQPYVNQLLHGHVPSREKLLLLVNGIGIAGRHRQRLFAIAGYADEMPPAESRSHLPEGVASIAQEMVSLTEQQLDTVRRLLREPKQLDALQMLLDSRVIHGAVYA